MVPKNAYIYIIVLLISSCTVRKAEKHTQGKERVLGYNTKTMYKRIGESELGNLLADALLFKAKSYSKQPVDFAIVHLNEINVPQLPQGNITMGMLQEMIPSDNEVVLVQLNGEMLKEWFDYMGKSGGMPIAGARYEIRDRQWRNLEIDGMFFQETRLYTVAVSDYWIKNINELKWVKKTSTMRFLRDAISEYIEEQKTITGKKDGRVVVVMR